MSDPSKWVEPVLDDGRRARQWDGIAPRLEAPRRRFAWIAAPIGIAAAVALAFVLLDDDGTSATTVTNDGTMTMADGSRVEKVDGAEVRVDVERKDLVALTVVRGRATFDVTKRPERRFEVRAADVQVVVVGTRFDVGLTDSGVSVEVREGIVEVRAKGEVHRLTAGERYPKPVAAAPVPTPTAEEEVVPAETTPKKSRRTKRKPKRARPPKPESAPAPVTKTEPEAPADPYETATSAQLFEAAVVARRAGRHRQSERALETLLRRFPKDRRAGLAAFQLGRLRMDTLKDRRGATKAFETALARDPSAAFAEDAMARLVELYRKRGYTSKCRRMKKRYEERYPAGAHLTRVDRPCER